MTRATDSRQAALAALWQIKAELVAAGVAPFAATELIALRDEGRR